MVEDLGSLNGSYINTERVEGTRQLRPGDILRLGKTKVALITATNNMSQNHRARLVTVGNFQISCRHDSPGERFLPSIEEQVRRCQRKLGKLLELRGDRPIVVRLSDPVADPVSHELITSGTLIEPPTSTIWVIVTAESPPEPIARAVALMCGAELDAAPELALLLEGYGTYLGSLEEEDDGDLAGVDLPDFAAAPGPLRARMAASFVKFLIALSSENDLLEVIRSARRGELDRTLIRVYGRGLSILEQRWRNGLRNGTGAVKANQFLRLAAGYIRPHWRREIEMFAYMLLGLAFTMIFPFQFKKLLDVAIPDRDLAAAMSILTVVGVALAISLLATLRRSYLSAYVSGSVVRQIRAEMFGKLQQLDIAWHLRRQQGDVLSRLFNDVGLLEAGISQTLRDGVFQILTVIVTSIVLFILNPLLGAIVAIGIPLVALAYRVMSKGAQRRSIAVQEETGVVVAIAAENYSAQPVVRAFGLENREIAKLAGAADRLFKKQIRLNLFGGTFSLVVNLVVTVLRLVVLALGTWLVLHGHLTLGGLVAFTSLMGEAIDPVTALTSIGQQILASSGALVRINEILHSEPEVAEHPDAANLEPLQREIQFSHVTFGYDGSTMILNDVDLSITAGTRVALVGPTGAGKSSILQVLLRFYDPQQGRVLIDGNDIRGATLESLRGQMGVVFQDTCLFEGTCRDNILVGDPDASQSRIEQAVAAAELSEFIASLPNGLDTLVGERGARLSGGQRQRMAIARALLRDPRILILDEATSALDPRTEGLIVDTLEKASRGRTTLAVTHRLTSVVDYDRILVVANGSIVEDGTHEQLVRRGGIYADLWTEQIGSAAGPDETELGQVRSALAATALFASVTSKAVAAAADMVRIEHLDGGERLYDDGMQLAVVRSGAGSVAEIATNGAARPIADLAHGDAFGLSGIVGQPTGSALVANGAVTLYVLDARAIEFLAAEFTDIADGLSGTRTPGPSAGEMLLGLSAKAESVVTRIPLDRKRRIRRMTKNPVLDALVVGAVNTTGASGAWLLHVEGTDLRVVATTSQVPDHLGLLIDDGDGVAGLVVRSGQPMSISASGSAEPILSGLEAVLDSAPQSLLCLPCFSDEGVIGVLVLLDKTRGGAFTIDDVEVADLVVGVASAVLAQASDLDIPTDPGILSDRLTALAHSDPVRYHHVSSLVESLLA
ncbi:ABC transporter transmembrane domain-containing protein [Smaragdicoccus niigatensis]